jgi:hypothetical protein
MTWTIGGLRWDGRKADQEEEGWFGEDRHGGRFNGAPVNAA